MEYHNTIIGPALGTCDNFDQGSPLAAHLNHIKGWMKWLVKYFMDLDTILNMLSHATIAMVFRKHVVLD